MGRLSAEPDSTGWRTGQLEMETQLQLQTAELSELSSAVAAEPTETRGAGDQDEEPMELSVETILTEERMEHWR